MDSLLNLIKGAINQHSNSPNGFDPQALIGTVENLFGQHQAQQGDRSVLPASQDPYGDPGAGSGVGAQFGNARPASQDPYGDPGAAPAGGGSHFGNVKPASQDPYGDPG